MSRQILILAAGLCTATVAASARSLHAQGRGASPTLIPPEVSDRFRLQESEPIPENLGGGTLYRYTDGTGTRVSVFIYPMRPEHVQAGVQQALSRVTAAFIQDLPEAVKRGWYEEYKVAENHPISVQTSSGTVPGHSVAVAVSTNRGPFAEIFYILAIDRTFVKIRATVPVHPSQSTDLPRFVEEFVKKLTARGG